jgi:hypothetical protein
MPPTQTRPKRGRQSTISDTVTTGKRARTTSARGTPSQPITIDSQTQLPLRSSPRRALADAPQPSPPPPPPPTFESQLREIRLEAAIIALIEASEAAIIAIEEASDSADDAEDGVEDAFDARFADNFDGIDWSRLSQFMKPVATQQNRKSWIYRHSYRLSPLLEPKKTWFVCKYCH